MDIRLPFLREFQFDGDENTLRLRWIKWKRAFQIYITAANINDEETKLANLLHNAGIAFQDIFYSINNVHEEGDIEESVYQIALKKLDKYFNPNHGLLYERYIF